MTETGNGQHCVNNEARATISAQSILEQIGGIVSLTARLKVETVITQIIGALARAVLVVLLIATPALLLPGVPTDTTQIVTLVALFAATLTLFEYASTYPSMIEFRFAPPFNRMRFVALFLTVFLLTVVFRGADHPTPLTSVVTAVGTLVGQVIDFPFGPWRLLLDSLSPSLDAAELSTVRAAAGISYVISMVMLAIFVVVMRLSKWPVSAGQFNVWLNLPLFDPTAGGDVVDRLNRDARINLILGLLLPFIVPGLARFGSGMFDPDRFLTPQPLIWMFALWAFLPASLFMRGIALKRVAMMISQQRRARRMLQQGQFQPA